MAQNLISMPYFNLTFSFRQQRQPVLSCLRQIRVRQPEPVGGSHRGPLLQEPGSVARQLILQLVVQVRVPFLLDVTGAKMWPSTLTVFFA